MFHEIPLSRGLIAIVDECDYALVKNRTWCALKGGRNNFYAATTETIDGKSKMVLMHRLLTGAVKGQVVDHQDGDTLNNRRSNIRLTTQAENCLNRIGYRQGKSSRFKGVYAHQSGWAADFRGKYIGKFENEEDAARAYDVAALTYNPDFALLNFPTDGPCEMERRETIPFEAEPRIKTSSHKGVTFNKRSRKWIVQVKGRAVGRFATEAEAAKVAASAFAGMSYV